MIFAEYALDRSSYNTLTTYLHSAHNNIKKKKKKCNAPKSLWICVPWPSCSS